MTTTYTVRPNDNLTKIAKAHNMSVEKLAELNNIQDVNKIKIGDKLIFDKQEQQKPTNTTEISQAKLEAEVQKAQEQLEHLQAQMNSENNRLSELEMLGYGLGSVALYEGSKKALPYIKSAGETAYLRGLYAKDGVKTAAQKGFNKVQNGIKHAVKKIELEYAFGKDALKEKAKKTVKTTMEKGETAKKAISTSSTKTISKAKSICTKSNKIMKLTKAGKAVGKRLPGIGQAVAIAETVVAYKEGGTKAAVKQGVKSGTGLAAGAAGAKLGAVVGTAICPGIGTAIGAAIGGIGGYLAGEKAADRLISFFS